MSKTLYLMQGIPGSGKSTEARRIASAVENGCRIFSTDDFWGVSYNFNPKLIGRAHRWNQDRTRKAMLDKVSCIIIDNTNIKKSAVEPYREMAAKFGYNVVVVPVHVDIEVALKRNAERPANRAVPEEVIRRMHSEMEEL